VALRRKLLGDVMPADLAVVTSDDAAAEVRA
jgi:hypothetical protein